MEENKYIYYYIIVFCLLLFLSNKLYIHILFENFDLSFWRAFNKDINLTLFTLINKLICCMMFIALILLFNKKISNRKQLEL